jgi:hypothetical protein
MPVLGLLLIILGVAGDVRGWWEGFGFLTNLISSLTGLMFAVPFALVVLNRIGESHAEMAERRAAKRFSDRSLQKFFSVASVLQGTLRGELANFVHPERSDAQQLLEEIKDKVRQYDAVLDGVTDRWRVVSEQVVPRLAEVGLRLNMAGPVNQYARAVGEVSRLKDYISQIQVAPPNASGTHLVHDGGREVVNCLIVAIDEIPTSTRYFYDDDR